MEDYRRALESTKLKEGEKELTGKQGPTKKALLDLLRTRRVREFNDVRDKFQFIILTFHMLNFSLLSL